MLYKKGNGILTLIETGCYGNEFCTRMVNNYGGALLMIICTTVYYCMLECSKCNDYDCIVICYFFIIDVF